MKFIDKSDTLFEGRIPSRKKPSSAKARKAKAVKILKWFWCNAYLTQYSNSYFVMVPDEFEYLKEMAIADTSDLEDKIKTIEVYKDVIKITPMPDGKNNGSFYFAKYHLPVVRIQNKIQYLKISHWTKSESVLYIYKDASTAPRYEGKGFKYYNVHKELKSHLQENAENLPIEQRCVVIECDGDRIDEYIIEKSLKGFEQSNIRDFYFPNLEDKHLKVIEQFLES